MAQTESGSAIKSSMFVGTIWFDSIGKNIGCKALDAVTNEPLDIFVASK